MIRLKITTQHSKRPVQTHTHTHTHPPSLHHYSHCHCHPDKCTSVPGQRRAARSYQEKTVWPGNSTGKPGHSLPAHGRPAPAGSSSRLAWLHSLCCGRRGEPGVELSGSPATMRHHSTLSNLKLYTTQDPPPPSILQPLQMLYQESD